jgi:GntR family transcriptional regulator, transcriptional repressor for pyruvate dehydrogenase complex
MRSTRLAEVIAGDLRQRILDGDLADGDRLPPLDRLVARYEVSPPSIREALRVLETEGLIIVRRGKVGGATVHRPRPERAAYMLGLVLESQRTRAGDLTAALLELELACASACAQRDDRLTTLVPTMRKALDEAGDPDAFGMSLVTFHGAVTNGCGNETLVLLAGALGALWAGQELPWPHQVFDEQLDDAARAKIVDAYRSVLDAIEKGDPSEAARRFRGILADPESARSPRRRNPVVRAAQMTQIPFKDDPAAWRDGG